MRYVKVTVKGRAGTQPVINVLYYSDFPANPIGYSLQELESLSEAVYEAWAANVKPYLGAGYGIPYVEAVQIDEHGRTNGAIPILFGTNDIPNGYGATTDTRAVCAVLKFNTEPQALLLGSRRPARSYLAIGPLPSGTVGDDGMVLWNPSEQAAILAAVVQGHVVGTAIFEPYRVSLTPPTAQARVGKVTGGTISYKASVRRSRLNRKID